MAAVQERLLVVMNVDVGDGRTGKIEIKRGDDPVELARQFCDEHRLPVQAIPILKKSVEQSMVDAVAKADALGVEKQSLVEQGPGAGEQQERAGVQQSQEEQDEEERPGHDGRQEGERPRLPSTGHQTSGSVHSSGSRCRSRTGGGSVGRSQRGGSARGAGAGAGAGTGGAAPSSRGSSRAGSGKTMVDASPRRVSATSPTSMEGPVWCRLLEPTAARRGKLAAARGTLTRSWSTGDLSAQRDKKSSRKKGRREAEAEAEGVWKRLYESGLDKMKSSNKAAREGARPQSAKAKCESKQDRGDDMYTTVPGPFQRLFDDSTRRREIRESLGVRAEAERAKKDEEVMTPPAICQESRRIAESKSRVAPTLQVFDKLYKEGLELVKSREAIHQPPQQQREQSAAIPRTSMFDRNNNVSAFSPDLWSSRSKSEYKNVERSFERLDPLGEHRALLLEECELEQEVSQLHGCSFRPQILPYSESLNRHGSVFEHLYQHGLERHERQTSTSPSHRRDAKPLSPSKSQALIDRLHNQPMQQLHHQQPLASFSRTSTPSDKKPAFKPPGAPLALDKTPPVPGSKSGHRSCNSSVSPSSKMYNHNNKNDNDNGDGDGDQNKNNSNSNNNESSDEGIYGERRHSSSSALNARDLYCMPARDPREMSTERHFSREQARIRARERMLGDASVLASRSHMSPASKTLVERKQQALVGMWFDHAVNCNRPTSQLPDELGGHVARDLVSQVFDDIESRIAKGEVVTWEEFSEACDKRLHSPLAGGISSWDAITRIRRSARNNAMMLSSLACGGHDSQSHEDHRNCEGGAEQDRNSLSLGMTSMRTAVLDRANSAEHKRSEGVVDDNGNVATMMDKGQSFKQVAAAADINSGKTLSVGERLLREASKKNRERQEWLRGQKARRVAAELDECTFSPKILRNAGYEPYALAKRK